MKDKITLHFLDLESLVAHTWMLTLQSLYILIRFSSWQDVISVPHWNSTPYKLDSMKQVMPQFSHL